MEEFHYHHHHHHHHGHDGQSENEDHQHATAQHQQKQQLQVQQQQQQQQRQQQQQTTTHATLSVPTNQTFGGVQSTGSFHSVSSLDSLAEMSKYFPDAQTPNLSPFRHQQVVGGQAQSTVVLNTGNSATTNTINAAPYIPVSGPTAVQRLPQPIRAPFMAQQQQQRPVRPPGPFPLPPGIPSYPSQVEGLSVSQAVVNDVLVDLQTKVINETLQQYQNGPEGGSFLEPLPPIYIQAPQPTIILRSDINRLRTELNTTVRPPVVYRQPPSANQFQQHRFQQNTFQAPRFPAPPRQQAPPECYGEYRNPVYANSDEYKKTPPTPTTINDEHRKEYEARLYNQAESPMFNDNTINANVHSTLDLQGISATPLDRYASPYQSSSIHPKFEDQQQGIEKTASAASQRISNEEVGKTDNMPVQQRQEITFDIDNCIIRCFEAHRQRLARRRAARQARRTKRHKQSGQQQQQNNQQLYHANGHQIFNTLRSYSSFESAEQTPLPQNSTISSSYSETLPDSINTTTSIDTSERSYVPIGEHNYANEAQSTMLPSELQHYQSPDIVNIQTNQMPYPSLSTLNMNAALSNNIQSSAADYHQFQPIDNQESYTDSKGFDYASYQAVPSANDFIHQSSFEQQKQQQGQTSFEYSNQSPYTFFSSTDATVPGDIQHLTSNYYQQHQQPTPTQFIQNQETHIQPSNTSGYTIGNTQSQIPVYNYQNIEQQSFQYPHNAGNIQQQTPPLNYDTIASAVYVPHETDHQQLEQNQTFNYSSQARSPNDYYQQQQQLGSIPLSQTQEAYSQPTGSYEYTKESYHSQGPVYDYQGVDQQSSQYPYEGEDAQQISQQVSYDYPTAVTNTNTYSPSQIDSSSNEQKQTFDYSRQAISTSDFYRQLPGPISISQTQETFTQPSGSYEYAAANAQLQAPAYDYHNIEQQPYEYPYNTENIEQQQQQQQQQSFDYRSDNTSTYISPESNVQQTEQKKTFDYTGQALSSSNPYQQRPISTTGSQFQGSYNPDAGTFEYTTGSTDSQAPIYDHQSTEQQSYPYPYSIENIEQQQSFDYRSDNTGTYISPETNTHQTETKQPYDYTSQALTSSDPYQQHPVSNPLSQVQRTYDQATAAYEYGKESYQPQEPLFDYQNTDQHSSHYSYNLEDTRQQVPLLQEVSNYASEETTAHSTSETDIQQSEQRQRSDYPSQSISSIDHFQQKPVAIPISQVYDSQPFGRRLSGASIPTGTVEYTRKALYSHEPSPEKYTKETYNKQHEESETFSINDYLKRFESESYSQQAGGQIRSSDDYQSITTTTTTPNTIQPTADIYQPAATAQIYDLQNYTNDSIVSTTPHQAAPTSSTCEEDHQHLLQHTSGSEQMHEPIQQSEQRSEIEASIYDTYSSLPPPPPPPPSSTTRELDHQHRLITANTYDFPAPPTPDRHSYQLNQNRPNRSFASIIPSTDQPSIYSGQQQLQITSPTSSDNKSDEDVKEDEEIFDLRECIARCYAKYRDSWNQEQQRQYEQQMNGSRQTSTERTITDYQQITSQQSMPLSNQQLIQQSNTFLSFHGSHPEQLQQRFGEDEIHYNDGWTQTASADVSKHSNAVQHAYDQTPSAYDTKPYVPQLPREDFSTDSRGQQTIEYSPPLITQTHHVLPTIPPSTPLGYNESIIHGQQQQQEQQQQQMYNHILPVPPHLSFDDTSYQSNLYFPQQIAVQPQKYENIPFDKHDDDEQQQRFRAHSEPVSIQQDSLATNPPSQSISSHIFDQQSRRSNSIPMIHHQEQQQQNRLPSFRMLENGRAYETDAVFQRHVPRIDPKTGLCLVPCPETTKYAHLPPHLRPELFCIELPPARSLPPVPSPPPLPPPPPPQQQQQQRWCVRCCCNPGQTLIKKVVYKEVEEDRQQKQGSDYDYGSIMDQMATKISVRYGNDIMEEGEPFVPGNYCEKLRIIDFPVYVSGKNDPNLTPLVPVH